ncbi:MAG TPA: MASE1 domain-containing protein [Pseudomonadales bacterium]|nr:MASE1 domain-containing protein [Pseudomonadales bacterium]
MNGKFSDGWLHEGLNYAVRVMLLAVAYAVIASVVLKLLAPDHIVSLMWPLSGLSVAVLLIGGARYWPGLFLGTLLGVYYQSAVNSWPITLAFASGNTLEYLLAWWLLARVFRINPTLEDTHDYYSLVIAGAAAAIISATCGAGTLWLTGRIADQQFFSAWLSWWQGNELGVILFAPLLLVWRQKLDVPLTRRTLLHGGLCLVLAFFCGQIIFLNWFDSAFSYIAKPFWMFIFVMWAAIRLGRHGVLLVLAMVAVQGIAGIMNHNVIFAGDENGMSLINYWLYMVIITMVGMYLALIMFRRHCDQQALRESEERWNFALEGSGNGVWDWNMEADRVHLSAYFMRMYDYYGDSVEATPAAWSELVHPDDMAQVLFDFDEHIAGRTSFYENEHRVRCKDGTYKWVLDRGMIVRYSAQGKPLRMVGTHSDISDKKMAEAKLLEANVLLEQRVAERTQALENAKQDAESAVRIKTDFLSNMSHEIRTPISNIINISKMVLKTNLDNRQQDYLEKIQVSGRVLLELVDDVLDYSHLESGKLQLDRGDIDIASMIESVVALYQSKAKEKGIKIIVDVDARVDASLIGDAVRLKQMLANYISNAVKFSEKGKITIRVFVVAGSVSNLLLRFEVVDEGIGISPQAQQKLFAAFQQADMSLRRQFGGSGLGLAINRRLSAMMGGEVGFESQSGKGSTFWFTARLTRLDAPELAKEITLPAKKTLVEQRLQNISVLLVEDDHFNQQVTQELLEMSGAAVTVASNGQEALQCLADRSFDCILMDLQMPVMDGLEATRLIRADAKLRDSLIIAMTANIWGDGMERCFAAGVNDFLGKPVRPDLLIQAVAVWVNSNRHYPVDTSVLMEAFDNDAPRAIDEVGRFIRHSWGEIGKMRRAIEMQDMDAACEVARLLQQAARRIGVGGFTIVHDELMRSGQPLSPMILMSCLRQMSRILERITQQLQLKG